MPKTAGLPEPPVGAAKPAPVIRTVDAATTQEVAGTPATSVFPAVKLLSAEQA